MIVNKIYIYSLYVLGLVLFIVGLFLPSDPMHPSFAVVGLAYLLLLVLLFCTFLEKVICRVKKFRCTLTTLFIVVGYHLSWLLYAFLERVLHWSNGTETLLFLYYMTISPLRTLPQISPHEGVNMIFYSIAIPASIAIFADGIVLLLKKLIKIIAAKYRQKNNVSKGC